MTRKYDCIVIGAGHNGLTAATVLARKGKRVLVLEARERIGGVAAGEEFMDGYFSPGVLHSTHGVREHVVKVLSLEKHGLKINRKPAPFAILGKKNKAILISDHSRETAERIAQFSEKDSVAYLAYREFLEKITPFIRDLWNSAPPDITHLNNRQIFSLAKKAWGLKRLGNKTMLDFLRSAPMSVADFMHERFETEFLKAGLCTPAVHAGFFGSWSSGTTLNLLVHECTATAHVQGGPAALVVALENAARAAGVEIRTNAPVEQIHIENNQVTVVELPGERISTNCIAAACAPQETILNLIHPKYLSRSLDHGITHFRARGTTAKVHLALNAPLQINGVSSDVEYFRTGVSIDAVERAFDTIKYRTFSQEPVLDIYAPILQAKKSVSILVHYVPYHLEGGWNADQRAALLENVLNTMEYYASGLRESIVGTELLTPVDLAEKYRLPNGNLYHGEHAIDQLITRPIPSCMTYTTPIGGLYFCGSGSHPGGGINCMPGYLGAQAILG